MISAPPDVSAAAWWRLAMQDGTLLRAFENELIARLVLTGSTLDVGGGKGFGYVEQLKVQGRLDSVNIAPEVEATFTADLNQALPFADGAYDNVISFNTVEHIFNEQLILAEMLRVLRPGGRFVITAPFLFRRHSRYGDYHRHTADYWEQALLALGQDTSQFKVQPLLWCPLSTALTSMRWCRGGVRGRLTKLLVMAPELLRQALTKHDRAALGYGDCALGICMDGTKRAALDLKGMP